MATKAATSQAQTENEQNETASVQAGAIIEGSQYSINKALIDIVKQHGIENRAKLQFTRTGVSLRQSKVEERLVPNGKGNVKVPKANITALFFRTSQPLCAEDVRDTFTTNFFADNIITNADDHIALVGEVLKGKGVQVRETLRVFTVGEEISAGRFAGMDKDGNIATKPDKTVYQMGEPIVQITTQEFTLGEVGQDGLFRPFGLMERLKFIKDFFPTVEKVQNQARVISE